MARGPLAGTRVLDLTRVWAGPLAGRTLADLGADVIKLEAPTERGPRSWPRGAHALFPGGEPGERPWNRMGIFNKLNRNKRSLVLDLKREEGRALFLGLVERSDVLIENFSARAMQGLGLGYARLREVNPGLVYLAMPGFGRTGPLRDWVAFGPVLEAMSAIPQRLGYVEGEPRLTSTALPDPIGGIHAAFAVLAALHERERSGRGCFVDLSQYEAAVSAFGEFLIAAQLDPVRPPHPLANRHPAHCPSGVYRCRGDDRWIAIDVRSDAEWRALCRAIRADWDADPRFHRVADRGANHDALDREIEACTSSEDAQALAERLRTAGVPAAPVNAAPDLLADPQLRARGYFRTLRETDVGPIDSPGTPLRLDGETGAQTWTPAPTFGQHNREVLRELAGLSDAEIDALERDGILRDSPPA
jgi:crotonobetainyl-CoA:carnitine CoA-transferase CaiB-like acyl-CoA transferase